MLVITKISCVDQNSLVADDSVYFLFTIDNGTTFRYPTWDHRDMSQDSGTTYKNTWYAGRSAMFNSQVAVTLYSEASGDDDQLGNTVTFQPSDFSGVNTSVTKNAYRAGDLGNGYNVISYNIYATRIK